MDGLEDYDDEAISLSESRWHNIKKAADIQVILLSAAAILGICSNIYVVWLIYSSKCRSIINLYILHRSFADLLFLATVPFIITQIIERTWPFGVAICKISIAMTHSFGLASGFFLGALSISCYFATAGSYGSFSRKQWFMLFTVLTWLCAIVYSIPHLIFFGIMEHETPIHTETFCTLTSHSVSISTYLHVTNTIIIVIPMLISIFMSSGICLVNPARIRMLELDAETRSGKSLLVALTINYVIMSLPFILVRIVHYILPQYDEKMIIALFLLMPLPFIESAVSPLLYLRYKGDLLTTQQYEVPYLEPAVALVSSEQDRVSINYS